MPIYEFECRLHGRFEKILPISRYDEIKKNGVPCELNKGTGFAHLTGDEFGNGRAYLVSSVPANIQIGKPTVVFINPKTGIGQVASSEYDQPPPGFIKEELKGSIERTKFENLQNKINAEGDMIYNENLRVGREDARNAIIKDIDANIREDAQASDNPELTAKLMRAAKDHIRKKPILKRKRNSEFRFDVNHLDKSNLK